MARAFALHQAEDGERGSGIETFEEAFLAHAVVNDDQTVYDHVPPKLIEMAKTGQLVPPLPANRAGTECWP